MHIAKLPLEQIGVLWAGFTLLGAFMFAVLQCACDRIHLSSRAIDWIQTTRVVYQYGDSSVPPEYHRSYRMDVSPGEVRVIVDSYGTILADKRYPVTRAEFDGVLDSLSRHAIRNVPLSDSDGCTGGTSETIQTFNQQTRTFSGRVYHCGGEDSGDLGGNVRGFADDLRAFIPELPDLLR